MRERNKALDSFLVESQENLLQLEQDLVELERHPDDDARLARAFRAMHTIKGTCGFFGFPRLERVTHAMEDVLGALRDGHCAADAARIGLLLEGVDAVRQLLTCIERDGNDGSEDYAELIARLQADHEGSRPQAKAAPATPAVANTPAPAAVEKPAATPKPATTPGEPEPAAPEPGNESSIRVDVALLDKLMNVVGELVLARNQLLQYAGNQQDSQLLNLSQRLNLVTSELQEGLMKTRMQPIGNAWASYPRLLRDLEQQTGKRIRLEQEGGDTELDRSLLQAIRDPLVHLLRNAVDHGIETPEARVAAGKPAEGQLSLRAYHESGNVIIELADDGAGINRKAILARAVERGLLREDQVDALSDRDILDLIFRPGFSTAEKVSAISGRGVGLDVVRTNVERIGGTIDLLSEPGAGTRLKIKIPLTLAIIPALIIGCRHDRYAVPQINLLEVVHVQAENARDIEQVHGALVYRLRGKLLPLVDLRTLLGMQPRQASGEEAFILVLQAESQVFGLVVDSVRDTEEIVVKPLDKLLRDVHCFAGATIMGDGRVALILDVRAIAEHVRLLGNEQRTRLAGNNHAATEAHDDQHERLLLVQPAGHSSRAAIRLAQVARLEEFPANRIEWSAGREVVQYRNRILPLVPLHRMLGLEGNAERPEQVQVVVQSGANGDIGLLVGRIIDIVDDRIDGLQRDAVNPCIAGSAIIQGHVTDVIDSEACIQRWQALLANPDAEIETAGSAP